MGIVIRLAISAVAVWIATLVVHGVRVNAVTVPGKVGTIIVVAVIFGVINAILRPIIKGVGCAFYILTLGLVSLVVNGALFMLTSWVAGKLNLPFHVDHFWPSAVVGALLVGIISWLLGLIVPDGDDD